MAASGVQLGKLHGRPIGSTLLSSNSGVHSDFANGASLATLVSNRAAPVRTPWHPGPHHMAQ